MVPSGYYLHLHKFVQRSRLERRLFLEAWGCLALARVMIVIMPFRLIARRLGRTRAESSSLAGKGEGLARTISWAVRTASRYSLWRSTCLTQAMAAKMMLRRRQLPNTLYLGLAKDEEGTLRAHAWLRCGEAILTGGENRAGFTTIASFADD